MTIDLTHAFLGARNDRLEKRGSFLKRDLGSLRWGGAEGAYGHRLMRASFPRGLKLTASQ
jgi:hypothetical protein